MVTELLHGRFCLGLIVTGVWMVLDNETSTGSSIVGGFYTPTNQVENPKDNDGILHPGSLQHYKDAFNNDGFDILSEYNFTYATCDNCPGEYWPDNANL